MKSQSKWLRGTNEERVEIKRHFHIHISIKVALSLGV